ncbi:MAG: hypothetical protein MMC33_000995 [Icmadophila ericetorum]|nr:hypothetical protein [Icmadophila ericetorum]
MNEPTGIPIARWVNSIPNEGLMRYRVLFNKERILITSPKAVGEVLVSKNYDWEKPSELKAGLGRLLGDGILLAEGDEHKRQRKHLTPAFSFRHIKDLYPIFWTKSVEMVKAITQVARTEATQAGKKEDEPTTVIEVSDWASRVTLDIIGVAGMGQDFGAIEDPNTELNRIYRTIFSPNAQAKMLGILGIFLPFFIIQMIPVKRNSDVVVAVASIRKVCRQLIQSKQRKLNSKEPVEQDILTVALQSGGFSEDNLVDQLMTFLAAGHETTATAVTWAILHLCQSPDVQAKLRAEVRAGLPSVDSPDEVTSEMLDKMPYLHAVCNEVLRVNCPVTLTRRAAVRDTSILGQYVPKGTDVIICPLAMNTSTALWGPDAAKFTPDRWLAPGMANNGGAESAYANLTFLHGPRSCIGQAFSKAEFHCILAAIVGRFEMELEDPNKVIEIGGGITAKPKGGLRVKVKVLDGW